MACLMDTSIYATNVVWNIVIPELHLSNAPLPETVASLEDISRKLDPKGRGIRIVYHQWPGQSGGEITFDATNILLHEAVMIVGRSQGLAGTLVDDVALFCERQITGPPVWRIAGITGRISDARNGAPVTNAWLITGDACNTSNKISISDNGHFDATVQHLVRRPFLYGIRLNNAVDDLVFLTFGAPGYKNTETNAPLGDLMADEEIPVFDIKLERLK